MSTTSTAREEQAEQDKGFGDYLRRVCFDGDPVQGRRAMMAMRSSLGTRGGIARAAIPFVAAWVRPPHGGASAKEQRRQGWREQAHYLVAGLYGLWHTGNAPQSDKGLPLGAALKRLRITHEDAAERLIRDLCTARQESVSNLLLRAVTLLAKEKIALNWSGLAYDLTSSDLAKVQREWASQYYRHPDKGKKVSTKQSV